MNSSHSSKTTLYRAQWVMPVTAPILADGCVLVGGGRILAVGPFSLLQREADRTVELDGALLPRLINCHSHLELAAYGEAMEAFMQQRTAASFPDWINRLLQLRADASLEPEGLKISSQNLLRQMAEEGVGLVLDTGNQAESCDLSDNNALAGHRFLLEMLGFAENVAEKKIQELKQLQTCLSVTAHAPYSTHPALLREIKTRCRKFGHIFSIHTAESQEEIEFLFSGSGVFVDFLKNRGVWDGSFHVPGCSTVQYFDQLGLLDRKTLCVHCVQVTDEDIEKLTERGAAVCLCPESNRTLGVGTAPVTRMAASGVRLCLGTDSRASNPHCSMWQEMRILAEEHPGLDPSFILAMATIGGATALGVADRFGSLEPGKRAEMVLVRGNFADHRQLAATLVGTRKELDIENVRASYA